MTDTAVYKLDGVRAHLLAARNAGTREEIAEHLNEAWGAANDLLDYLHNSQSGSSEPIPEGDVITPDDGGAEEGPGVDVQLRLEELEETAREARQLLNDLSSGLGRVRRTVHRMNHEDG